MLKRISLPFLGFLQATGLFLYIMLISGFFTYMAPLLDHKPSKFIAPVMMLLLLVLSATISGLLVLGRAGFLFWEKRYRECFTLVSWTVGWGILYFVVMMLIMYFQ